MKGDDNIKTHKLKNGDAIKTIWGETAIISSIGKYDLELTKLDRQIQIGYYSDGVPHYNQFIDMEDLYNIVDKKYNPNQKVGVVII